MGIRIRQLDHLVLTVATVDFHRRVLGMQEVVFGDLRRRALAFGTQKSNLNPPAAPFEPKIEHPTPAPADLCFSADTPLDAVMSHLDDEGVALLEGPVTRTGATHPLHSVSIRDPDANLIEISNPLEEPAA